MTLQKLISNRASIEAENRYSLEKERSKQYDDAIQRAMAVISQEAFKEGALSLLPVIEEISVKFAEFCLGKSVWKRSDGSLVMWDWNTNTNKVYTISELFSLFIEEYLKQQK